MAKSDSTKKKPKGPSKAGISKKKPSETAPKHLQLAITSFFSSTPTVPPADPSETSQSQGVVPESHQEGIPVDSATRVEPQPNQSSDGGHVTLPVLPEAVVISDSEDENDTHLFSCEIDEPPGGSTPARNRGHKVIQGEEAVHRELEVMDMKMNTDSDRKGERRQDGTTTGASKQPPTTPARKRRDHPSADSAISSSRLDNHSPSPAQSIDRPSNSGSAET
ncbi:hypothetical protein BJ508DRAFT_365067, partial [Ascobolus immersus RN42]